MANQTTYNAVHDKAYAGMVADTGLATIVSRSVQTAALGFGLPAARGTADRTARPVTTGDVAADIEGISVRNQALDATNPNATQVGYSAPIMLTGTIWVTVGEAVAAGDPVLVTVADGTITKTAGAGKVALPDAYFETSAANGALAVVRLK